MKKIAFIGSLLVLSLQAAAGSLYFAPSLFMEETTSHYDNFRGLYPKFAVGYWDLISYFYLAGELYLTPTTLSLSESNNNRAQSARTTTGYGASIIPGLLLSETIIGYLRLGYEATNFYGPDTTKSGAQFGAGLQSSLSENWSIRVEYLYTAYSNVASIGSPSSDQYGLGLIYKLQ